MRSLNTSSLLHLQAKLRASHRGGGRDHHLASGFDCLAEGSAAGFAVEHVCDEQILSGVHDEGALLHVATDTEERQVTHSAFGDELVVLRGASIDRYRYRMHSISSVLFSVSLTFGVRMEIMLGATATFTFRH